VNLFLLPSKTPKFRDNQGGVTPAPQIWAKVPPGGKTPTPKIFRRQVNNYHGTRPSKKKDKKRQTLGASRLASGVFLPPILKNFGACGGLI